MPKWFTKSGKFNETEKTAIKSYLTKEGITVNELIRKAVGEVIIKEIDVKNKVDKCLPDKTKRYNKVLSGRVPEDHISKIDKYLLKYDMDINSLVRGAVFYFIHTRRKQKEQADKKWLFGILRGS